MTFIKTTLTATVIVASAEGLVETLDAPGNLTVYVPVNDAFTALPEGTIESLFQPENKDQLTDVLLYHVDDCTLMSTDFQAGLNYFKPILDNQRLCITAGADGVTIAHGTGIMANVIIANIKADSGVIHVIDKVLIPGTRPACH